MCRYENCTGPRGETYRDHESVFLETSMLCPKCAHSIQDAGHVHFGGEQWQPSAKCPNCEWSLFLTIIPKTAFPRRNAMVPAEPQVRAKPTLTTEGTEAELEAALVRRLDACFCDDVGQLPECERCLAIREVLRLFRQKPAAPIPMLLWCPKCHSQHVDREEWATPAKAHRKHLCEACGHTWKPAAAATVGVEKLPEE
jgi:hypothetical protein